ncbi:helix-turn-helix domain-containing protein [Dyadobacter sp. CY261]|uniref:AraC family transcriptional regulator n=1 Tax=Dyadobacter sp. CY261 TaxID=2907203 RepID=UPI001F46DA1A|nr:helix-turn-helix domain-containing protein [Dyadobacter sp. CY261]MCF0074215.1 helix-turn-helix domain-containing protein [Dyadobacter sp. CY261]
MDNNNYFVTKKPLDPFLSTLVDCYFYIDVPASQLALSSEYIIPFPRITFGYFFDYPFTVTNLSLNQSVSVEMVISRISTQKIVVQPQTDRIKIIGAHVRPFGLAYFTKTPIKSLPWLINTQDLFQLAATAFKEKIQHCTDTEQMFDEVENIFLDHLLARDLSLITTAVELMENNAATTEIKDLARQLNVSDRTLRNHFYDHIGCSPKEYLRLVKLKQAASKMIHSGHALTRIAHESGFFDQAHFINDVKDITGYSPNNLRKQIPHFRFLQF